MTETKRFPAETLSVVEAHLAQILHGYVHRGEVPRCLLAFLGAGQSLDIRPALKTDPDWQVFFARANEGLIGHVLKTGKTETWPSSKYFKQGDHRTIFEIGTPILYQGLPTAVLLVDYFDGELVSEGVPGWMIEQWSKEIESNLTAIRKGKEEIEKLIVAITERCVAETDSVGGYTALKRWDGTMIYFLAGKNKDRFRYFSQLEGICGDVMRKGEPQNVPYVWDHPHYRSSDDKVISEFVAPVYPAERIGVLNMEAVQRNHYTDGYATKILYYAAQLAPLAKRYREIVGSRIGTHGSLLSDLIEQLSASVGEFFETSSEENPIRKWAFDLLDQKVRQLDDVHDLRFSDLDGMDQHGSKQTIRMAGQPLLEYEVQELSNGLWECQFDMLDDAITISRLKVAFKNRPADDTIEIIDQFCRLVMNEVRRREEETRSTEFERLMADICNLSVDEALAAMPDRFKRIFNCNDVTYFVARRLSASQTILVPWSSTSMSLGTTSPEYFYHVAPNDGFTGFAATKRDILLIRNALDGEELKAIDPQLAWRGKIYEGSPSPVRTFLAIPLYVDDELVGLARGHRNIKTNNISFTEVDRSRACLIKFFLEKKLGNSAEFEQKDRRFS